MLVCYKEEVGFHGFSSAFLLGIFSQGEKTNKQKYQLAPKWEVGSEKVLKWNMHPMDLHQNLWELTSLTKVQDIRVYPYFPILAMIITTYIAKN